VIALAMTVLILAGSIWARLFYWQVLEHGELSQWAAGQYEKVVPLPATRGVLYDRDLRPLAVNTTVYSVFVSPAAVPPEDRERVAATLTSLLGVDHDKLLGVLGSGRQFAYVARRQAKEKADQVQAAALPGVGLEAERQRSYLPGGSDGSLAANLLGFVNVDGQGQYGVEGFYDARLAGKVG
jgi:cell division protein FtsI/penicillin-binding protein 2